MNLKNCHLFCHQRQTKNEKVALRATFKAFKVVPQGFEPWTQ